MYARPLDRPCLWTKRYPPEFHFQASPLEGLTCASSVRSSRGRPSGSGIPNPVGGPTVGVAPRERVDSHRPKGGHPIPHSTRACRLPRPELSAPGVQAVHPVRVRSRLGGSEGPSPTTETKEAILGPMHTQAHAQGGEPVLSAPPRGRPPSHPEAAAGRSTSPTISLRIVSAVPELSRIAVRR